MFRRARFGLLGFALIAATASFLVAAWAVDQVRAENARDGRFNRLRDAADGIQRQEVDAMSTMVRDLAAHAPATDAPEDSVGEFLSRMEGEMRISRTDLGLLLDSNGRVRQRRQDPSEGDLMGQDLSFRRYYREAKAGREDLLGALGAYTRKRGIYASAPVVRAGRFVGVAVTRLRADEIERIWITPASDPTALLTPEGVVLASNVEEWRMRHAPTADWTLARAGETRQFGADLRPLDLDLLGSVVTWKGRSWNVVRAPLSGGWTLAGLLPVSARSPLSGSQKGALWGLFLAWTLLVLLGAAVVLGLRRFGRMERERGSLARRLDEAERLESLGRLAGGIAHDFNNVLTAIIGYSSVLEMRLSDRVPEQEMVRRTGQAARRASETVKQLMAFARRSGLESRPVSVHELLRELASLLEHTFPRQIRVVTDLTALHDVVVGDPNHLHQALLNLAVNARDAMSEGGTLGFSTRNVESSSGLALELRVSDTGHGIPSDVLPHVFEPFFTTKSGGRGTGLGLASVWGTVRRHGGSIRVQCPPEGGTEFVLQIPLAAPGTSATPPAPAPSEGPRRRFRICALDDDPHVLEALGTMCGTLGHEIEVHSDHESLLARLNEGAPPDLLVLDLEMASLPGTEVLRRLRRTHPELPVLVASGHSSASVADEIRRLGVRVFLPKPFDAADLARAVEETVQRRGT
jgi:C4-dicarboxylate-specific signal transduction histidine kinase/ActR/RegA family two-component response regulator